MPPVVAQTRPDGTYRTISPIVDAYEQYGNLTEAIAALQRSSEYFWTLVSIVTTCEVLFPANRFAPLSGKIFRKRS